nr:MAG TPA: hypothetical protein [Caudoviricetes sp.]
MLSSFNYIVASIMHENKCNLAVLLDQYSCKSSTELHE